MTLANDKMMAVEGDKVEFVYNGKFRKGTIEAVRDTVLTLNVGEGQFRSFSYGKIIGYRMIRSATA